MPPEARNPTHPAEWLRRARSNLARAKADRGLPDVLREDLCFDAQQAAEKAIKAVLVARQAPFPKTHAIGELLVLAEHSGVEVPATVRESSVLSGFAVDTRYPGLAEDVTEDEYREAVTLADRVLRWAETVVESLKT